MLVEGGRSLVSEMATGTVNYISAGEKSKSTVKYAKAAL